MKTLFTVAAVAFLAIVFVEINAQGGGGRRRCPVRHRPPINTTGTEVKCDKPSLSQLIQNIRCAVLCSRCYNQTELNNRVPSCLVERKCHCLGNPGNGTISTTPGVETGPTSTTDDGLTTLTSELSTSGAGEESTSQGGESGTSEQVGDGQSTTAGATESTT